MSYFENPKVDRYSEASEESILAAKRFFSQRKGYLVREENPDKGVDLDVELLIDGQVSGFKFAIQVKSVQKLDKIKKSDSTYIRYSLKTSRLNYLCRRLPGFGIILLYDDQGKQLYFEHVKEIHDDIMDDVGDDSWKNNETVTIRIDEKNVLNEDSIKKIYERFKTQHLNFSSMYEQKAASYDLPTFDSREFSNPLEILDKYGYTFFNKQQYQIVYNLLSTLSNQKIAENHKILLLAAITYYEIGYYIDGDYYARKCELFLNKYSEEEKELLTLVRLSSSFMFGKINKSVFLHEMKYLQAVVKSKLNCLAIRMKIIFLEASSLTEQGEKCIDYLIDQITLMWDDVLESDLEDDSRHHYLVDILCTIHHVGVLALADSITRLRIHQKIFGELPPDERVNLARDFCWLLDWPSARLSEILNKAVKTKDDYLIAMILVKKHFMFHAFAAQSTFILLYDGRSNFEIKNNFSEKVFNTALDELIHAYNIFIKRMNLSNAYKAITLLIEINYLYSVIYQANINEDRIQKIKSTAKDIEVKLQMPPHEITTEAMFKKAVLKEDDPSLWDIPPNKMHSFAKMIAEYVGLPESRIENVAFDLRFLRDSKNAVNEQYFDVLQNLEHTKQIETMYEEKPKYVIRCKRCCYQTLESSDLQMLLEDLKINHGYICF